MMDFTTHYIYILLKLFGKIQFLGNRNTKKMLLSLIIAPSYILFLYIVFCFSILLLCNIIKWYFPCLDAIIGVPDNNKYDFQITRSKQLNQTVSRQWTKDTY